MVPLSGNAAERIGVLCLESNAFEWRSQPLACCRTDRLWEQCSAQAGRQRMGCVPVERIGAGGGVPDAVSEHGCQISGVVSWWNPTGLEPGWETIVLSRLLAETHGR